ncbi:hypothetical protein ONR57_08845 [Hoyosella sp. YIM 151337]|uniref:hypothetical protein n=1 Tax=Hoyosella sp. YIM 151337 TaxID=2992742 RepID=UPI0022361F09|nr:hypothetical protein [Hoyosella sp. YIM 151337]MCW4353402.1 hypothetical protein [Hoyosella sp. YIM 151337]
MGTDFADRLRYLIGNVHPPDRGPYSQAEIVRMVRARGGTIGEANLSQLLSRKRQHPGFETVKHLCDVFEVPLDFFGPEEEFERIKTQLNRLDPDQHPSAEDVINARTKDDTDEIAAAARELSEEDRSIILDLVRRLRTRRRK